MFLGHEELSVLSLEAPITRAARSQLSEGVIRMEERFRGGATDFERSLDLWL